jgi:hypothetical protein
VIGHSKTVAVAPLLAWILRRVRRKAESDWLDVVGNADAKSDEQPLLVGWVRKQAKEAGLGTLSLEGTFCGIVD